MDKYSGQVSRFMFYAHIKPYEIQKNQMMPIINSFFDIVRISTYNIQN